MVRRYIKKGYNLKSTHKGCSRLKVDESKVISLYSKSNSCVKIAQIMGCSSSSILRILHKNNITVSMKNKTYEEIYGKERAKEMLKDMSESRKKFCIEGRIKIWNKGKPRSEWLSKEKENKLSELIKSRRNKTYEEIYGEEKASEMRKILSSIQQGIPLEKWEKFISREPYDQNWDNRFRRMIRKRDNYLCMNCGIHSEKLSKALSIHHINYDKKLSIPQNCISLCLKCHLLTNINRPYWTKFFQDKLLRLYDYKYEEGNVILNFKQLELNLQGNK